MCTLYNTMYKYIMYLYIVQYYNTKYTILLYEVTNLCICTLYIFFIIKNIPCVKFYLNLGKKNNLAPQTTTIFPNGLSNYQGLNSGPPNYQNL